MRRYELKVVELVAESASDHMKRRESVMALIMQE
jgi:hypothetical protein